jgi:hypothetical protein
LMSAVQDSCDALSSCIGGFPAGRILPRVLLILVGVASPANAQAPGAAPADPEATIPVESKAVEPAIVEPASGETGTAFSPPESPLVPTPRPPPPPAAIAPPPRYGDAGTSEIALGLGYSTDTGLLAAGGFRYFVVTGLAPGLETSYFSGGRRASALGLLLLALRVVPVRTDGFALVLTARGGRVLIADHPDGWAAGGSGGVIVALGASAGLEIGYEALRLLPSRFCADLSGCVVHGPVLGLRLAL